ncbi:glutamate ABC transporter substrate-binding protein [Cellulomonas gilvus]|uniref:Extracellular solute-binding protein family 3 n=1 Tax=Cellulomonas gilvus (strain ATCC 13127 / NRRL B-14078) TaxID=593907 RepID=F8A4D7_CELGA|nr:glutamate ABC transporter substrate-binding protein [Cellulomonas gilvus]AEI12043.1 extracellular solute-binding protein family 3 [Cellulomonas gilvus ATCC 13127]
MTDTTTRVGRRLLRSALPAVLAVALALGACTPSRTAEVPTPAASASSAPAAPPAAAPTCSDLTASYAPDPDTLDGDSASIREIRERGRLVVGVSADTLLMGARNPLSGRIEGFDIDMLRAVAESIFGDPDRISYRVITSGQRLDVLQDGSVDLVARTFSITCERWDEIAFSAEYLTAGQKVLVTRDSTATGIADLDGRRVCAPDGTTTLARLAEYPGVEAVPAATHTRCLVLFQQGKVDAITGDDTILAGFAAQDPYAKVVGDAISAEPYGIGVAADDVELVKYVNAVLDEVKADGRWEASYRTWLRALGEAPEPPASVYGRTAP